jgi:hypothetical protein
VVIFIMLLAGFVPLLQVTFFALLEDYLSGLTRCERSGQNSEDHRRDPYHVVSAYWVAHGEIALLIVHHTGSCQIGDIGSGVVWWKN